MLVAVVAGNALRKDSKLTTCGAPFGSERLQREQQRRGVATEDE